VGVSSVFINESPRQKVYLRQSEEQYAHSLHWQLINDCRLNDLDDKYTASTNSENILATCIDSSWARE
jgi:hypothetical protein